MIPFDPIIDDKNKKVYLEGIVRTIWGEGTIINYSTGKLNIKYDFEITTPEGLKLKIELKRMSTSYEDLLVEITQYEKTSEVYDDMTNSKSSQEEVMTYLEANSKAWMFHTEADFILMLKPNFVLLVEWKKTKQYVAENLFDLEQKYSGKTTGAWNKVVPIRSDMMTKYYNCSKLLKGIYSKGNTIPRRIKLTPVTSLAMINGKPPAIGKSRMAFIKEVRKFNRGRGYYSNFWNNN